MYAKSVLSVLFLCTSFLYAQQIQQIEYYWDDPYVPKGQGIQLPLTPGSCLSVGYDIQTGDLEPGMHKLFIRTMDSAYVWSRPVQHLIRLEAPSVVDPGLASIEYFWDDGQTPKGSGTLVAVLAETEIQCDLSISLAGLSPGIHSFYSRAKDPKNQYTALFRKPVLVLEEEAGKIDAIEYFWNKSVPQGGGTIQMVPPGSMVSLPLELATSELSAGIHQLFFRTKSVGGRWSPVNRKTIRLDGFKAEHPNISYAEYFIDEDPGKKNGQQIIVSQTNALFTEFDLALPELEWGIHTLHFRLQDENGFWSPLEKRFFNLVTVLPDQEISGLKYFFDEDPGKGWSEFMDMDEQLPDAVGYFSWDVEVPANLSEGPHQMFFHPVSFSGIWGAARSHFIEIKWPTPENDKSLGKASLKVFPNPSHGEVNYLFESPFATEAQVQLFTATKQLIWSKKIRHDGETAVTEKIALSENENSWYLLAITTPDEVFTEKIILIK